MLFTTFKLVAVFVALTNGVPTQAEISYGTFKTVTECEQVLKSDSNRVYLAQRVLAYRHSGYADVKVFSNKCEPIEVGQDI